MESRHAYRCFCSLDRLNSLGERKHLSGLPIAYDRACANIPYEEAEHRATKGGTHTIRLKMPDKIPGFTDLTHGIVKDARSSKPGRGVTSSHLGFEDPILLKSDGLPTYHLANVVDDHMMDITHVIRASVCTVEKCSLACSNIHRNGCLRLQSTSLCMMLLAGNLLFMLMWACYRTAVIRNLVKGLVVIASALSEMQASFRKPSSTSSLCWAGRISRLMTCSECRNWLEMYGARISIGEKLD